jgi:flagellar hook-associated protein 2
LASYLGGHGVAEQSFQIIDSQGKTSAVNLKGLGAKTVGDVIDAINALSIGVEARINDAGDGIALIDTAGGAGKLTVKESGNGTAASDLRIKGEATTQTITGQPTQVIDGSTTLTVTLDGTQSLEDLVAKINEFNLGAKASIVTETAGSVKYRLSLQSLVDGKQGELLVDGSSLGIGFEEVTAAQDGLLQFGVNAAGSTNTLLTSTNNVYKDAAPGIDVTVLAASSDPINVTVGESSKSLGSAVQLFVDQYNRLRDKLTTYTAFNADTSAKGVLFGSSEALRVDADMGRMLTKPLRGLGSVQTLAELGVSIDDKGKLAFDATKLNARFEKEPEAVTKFFSDDTNGFAARADAAVEQLVGLNNSVLLNRAQVLQRQVEDYAKRIDSMTERLARTRETLLKQFYNMELVIGRIRSNLDAIGSMQYIAPVQRNS